MRICKGCGNEIVPPSDRNGSHWKTQKYCSGSCYHKHKRGSGNPNWKGGVCQDNFGYTLIYRPGHPFCSQDGYVREHRLAMEKHLGRHLEPSEIVHHINGIKNDNRIENLELCSSVAEHNRKHVPLRTRCALGRFV